MVEASARTSPTPSSFRLRSGQGSWVPVVLLCLWLAIEIGRPYYTLRLPLICSLTLGIWWIATPRKRWDPVLVCSIGFLMTGWLGVPFATNRYAAFWACYSLTIAIGCICLPAAHFLTSIRQIQFYVAVFLACSAYVGLFAIGHDGFGPAGANGGQDENYVSAAMSAALPFAYFALAATRSLVTRVVCTTLMLIFVLATVIGFSRGGFLGVAAAGLFCFWYSPRKITAIVSAILVIGIVASVAPDSYWTEIETIGDTKEGTADMRFELWTIATRQFLDNPIVGVAPGNFIWSIEKYQSAEQVEKFGRSLGGSAVVHSTYFEVLAELGALGVGFFLGMLYFTFRMLRRIVRICDKALARRAKEKHDANDLEWARALALGFQGGLIGYLVCSAFLSTTYFSTIWLLCAASVALRFVVDDLLRLRSRSPRSKNPADVLPGGLSTRPTPSDSTVRNTPPRLSDLLGGRG